MSDDYDYDYSERKAACKGLGPKTCVYNPQCTYVPAQRKTATRGRVSAHCKSKTATYAGPSALKLQKFADMDDWTARGYEAAPFPERRGRGAAAKANLAFTYTAAGADKERVRRARSAKRAPSAGGGSDARSRRNALVAEVMRARHVSLPEASRIIKEEDLMHRLAN